MLAVVLATYVYFMRRQSSAAGIANARRWSCSALGFSHLLVQGLKFRDLLFEFFDDDKLSRQYFGRSRARRFDHVIPPAYPSLPVAYD